MKWIKETQVPNGYKLLVKTSDFAVYSLDDFDVDEHYIKFSAVFVRYTRRATKRHAKMACKRFINNGLRNAMERMKKEFKDE